MTSQLMSRLAEDCSLVALDHGAPRGAACELRTAGRDDTAQIHALIEAHVDAGHLLPRTRTELETRASRFVVAANGRQVVACAELAPLSARVAEVRSLVVRRDARHAGVGGQLIEELARRARVQGFDTLCAFTHGAGFFVRRGFSLVPHPWLPEKLAADCQSCAQFRRCGQQAVVLSLTAAGRAGRTARA